MTRPYLTIASFVIVGMLGSLGVRTFATENPPIAAHIALAGETLDAALGDKVETLLRTDLGLTGSQLRILTQSGVVTVGGTVPDEHALRRALDLASSVRGVREVRNSMEIESPK
mgnify:CR=1 FL=1